MKVVTQHYIGTTEEWRAANPKLYNAVWGFERTQDGRLFAKMGNGSDLWNDLKYFDAENIKGLPEKVQEIFAAINAEAQARELAVSGEAEARQLADQILQAAVDAEAQARELAVSGEAEARRQADQSLQAAVDAETQAREQAVSGEAEARQLVDQNLQAAVEAEAQARELAVSGEAEARQQADQNLQAAVDAETQARELTVSEEAGARQQADQILQEAVDAEAQARELADQDLMKSIAALSPEGTEGFIQSIPSMFDDEAHARAAADQDLLQAVETEAQIRAEADQGLQQAVETEAQARNNSDQNLLQIINGEAESIQSLQAAVETEAQARQSADQALNARINQVQSSDAAKLNVSGGTMEGKLIWNTPPEANAAVKLIRASDGAYGYDILNAYRGNNTDGLGVGIGSGGTTIIGGGEARDAVIKNLAAIYGEGADVGIERMIVANDHDIEFISGLQTAANRRRGGVTADGRFFMDDAGIPANLSDLDDNVLVPKKLLNSKADTAGPVFSGAPKIGGDRIAVVASTSTQNDTNLPVGSYILVDGGDASVYGVNYTDTVKYSGGQYTLSGTNSLSGTWRSSGLVVLNVMERRLILFYRRVA